MSKAYLKEAVTAAPVAGELAGVRETVTAVIADIRARGDEAVAQYSAKFDNWSPASFKLSAAQVEDIILPGMPTRDFAAPAWRDHGQVIVVSGLDEAFAVADSFAFEHVEVLTAAPREALAKMRNFGALFLGEGTCVSYGDKVIGTNHVLPTRGAARYTGGLWVGKYLKTVTFQEVRDPSSPAAVAALRSALADENVSLLVNNAGIGGPVRAITEIDPQEWDEVFGANVRSVFLMCRAFLPAMYERGSGDIVNIASVTGKRPLARRTPYAASKMAVLGLTRALAFEAGPLGVRVNSLSPGPCRGERMRRNFSAEAAATGMPYAQAEEAFVSRAALRRLVEEPEVAATLLAMLRMPGLCGADIDLSAGMIAPA